MDGGKIVPRNLHFAFDASLPVYWHSGNPAITSYFDALSLTFPEGERFFIDSVKYYADRITDPKLIRDVQAFTAQEAVHSREHSFYNKNLAHSGVNVPALETFVGNFTKMLRKLPPRMQLAMTCSYEHFTALFAEATLGDPRVFSGAHPFYRDLWHWHAMEEEEHKAVAFDVFRAVTPGPAFYFIRCIAMALVTLDFTVMTTVLPAVLMWQRGQFWNLKAWAGGWRYHWIAPATWPRVLLGVARYFAPGFHPWKRKVAPEVARWRDYYRGTTLREAATAASIFESAPRGA